MSFVPTREESELLEAVGLDSFDVMMDGMSDEFYADLINLCKKRTFWKRCVDAQCVIIPLKRYTVFNPAGGLSEDDLIGIRYVAFPIDLSVAGPDYYFQLEASLAGDYPTFDTPEAALENYEQSKHRPPN